MPRRAVLALVLALAALGAAAPARAGTATDEMTRCADFGVKTPGSPAGRAMAAHLVERFRAAGLQTTTEDFHMPIYRVRRTSIRVVGPNAREVPGETFAYGGTGRVQAEVVDVGTGRESDYAGKDAKGKIVMVSRNEAYHRTSQLEQVVAHGGVAMLYVSGSPDNLVQTGTVRFAQGLPATIPTLTVGADDGAALRRQLGDGGLRMRLEVDASREDTLARNVIGVKRGTTHPDEIVVVGGHYDTWHRGAVDNCSSMGTMLEILETVKDLQPAYTLVFGAWDAEEIGLTGSYDWVMRHQDLMPRVVVNENIEMASAASYVGKSRLDFSALNLMFGTLSPALNAVVTSSATRNGFTPAPTTAAGVRSVSGGIIPTDLQPFYAQGVQGFSTFSSTPYYHTTEDAPDKIDPGSHARVTAFLRDALVGLQDVPPDALRLREVPTVKVGAPATASPGAPVEVEITVADPAGRPVTGAPVDVLVNQRDHWAVAEGRATEVGGGKYRYTIPRGATEADTTSITATVDQPAAIGEGFATIDQRRGGVLAPARACASRRRLVLHVRAPRRGERVTRVRARVTRGRVRVTGRRRIVVDLRGTPRGTVRVRLVARTSRGRTIRQTRTYRTCTRRGR